MRAQRFDVEGRGPFPYDMLRFDTCYPINHTATRNMEADMTGPRVVQLEHVGRGYITIDRWASFGWIATVVES